ncbi:hypothetical protein B0F90DRAFT_1809142 [Multifurca ochricompacta]|uniref:Uncharacterized protein n=1 Tax=Multifurca ochricompacta TaxID=376703 RepID=A0AAD4M6P8_9AGAM|nr:hypothetical protein B0F90DRAFT_1809142 [Multifurca ochricompacta]
MTTFSDTLSGILGWISIATWVVVYSPQIYENFSLKSGEGLSIALLSFGSSYTLCDTVLLIQIYYYRWLKTGTLSRGEVHLDGDTGEVTPLLTPVLVYKNRKRTSLKRHVLEYVGMVLCLIVAGVVAWAISTKIQGIDSRPEEVVEWKSQLMGYTSAMLYVGSRIPQILKNFKTHCHGLSPGLFIFGIMGNLTYALSICVSSMEMDHMIANASWLAGRKI